MPTMERNTNGAAVKALREAIGQRQEATAAAVGISRSFLANVEAGRKQPAPSVVRRLADHLGVPLDAITYPSPYRGSEEVPA